MRSLRLLLLLLLVLAVPAYASRVFDLSGGGGSGSGTPGGSDSQVQYNNGGAFGGASLITFDDVAGVTEISALPGVDYGFLLVNDDAGASFVSFGSGGGGFLNNDGTVHFNVSGFNMNMKISGGTDDDLFFMDGGNDAITIGSQTELAKFGIDGDADEKQFVVQAHSTQTANIAEIQTSAGAIKARITPRGEFSNPGALTQNEAFGNLALSGASLTGDFNTALGYNVLAANTDGFSNVGAGVGTLTANTTGDQNTAIGTNAMQSNVGGLVNSAFGTSALIANTEGDGNMAFGAFALTSNILGDSNVAVGSQSLYNTTASSNIGIGFQAGYGITSGSLNVAIGYQAGFTNPITGTYNLLFGYDAETSASNTDHAAAFGYASRAASHQFVAGSDVGYYDAIYFGSGVTDATPTATAINATGGSGTNIVGAALSLAGGKGTGNAAGGVLNLQTSDAEASGTTLQSLTTKLQISGRNAILGGGTTASEFRFLEPSGSGTNYSAFKAPALAADVTYTLPIDDGDSLQQLSTDGSGALDWKTQNRVIGITIDGGGATITTGVKGYIEVPYACTIVRATTLANASGSIVVDIWKDTYANYPPVDADSITASAPPTLSTAIKAQDATLTGWTTSVAAGDILGFNVDSATTVTRVHVILKCDGN